MSLQIENVYYIGKDQPYLTVNQALGTIAAAINSNNYILPSSLAPDGGQINVVLVGNSKFPPIKIPDNLTPRIAEANRFLIIRRQELRDNGSVITNALPVITPMSQNSSEISIEDKLIGIDCGSNNPNVKIIGLRVSGFIIGILAEHNCNNTYIDRCFITNCLNAQIYAHDINGLYLINNVIVGGQYGAVLKYVKNARVYHNTIVVDGSTSLDNITKAGLIIQGERLFGNNNPSTIYCLANIVYTIGCPAGIFYEEDLKNGRLVSDYNDWYSQEAIIQLRQDNATLPEDDAEVIKANYKTLTQWRTAGSLGSDDDQGIDQHSISIHPQFIQNVSLVTSELSSIINLGTIDNSPIIQKVPSWYYTDDDFYIPSDFNAELISIDSLLNTRQQPYTAIGANDKQSVNGFFGQDIFTSPLNIDPEKKCNLDPLDILSSQELLMTYPSIKAGRFWSHDRPYYLYGKKFAAKLGNIARTKFSLPGTLDSVEVYIKDKKVNDEDWDIIGREIYVSHKDYGITSFNDEVQIRGRVKRWFNNGFAFENAYYIFKIKDGIVQFILPPDYKPNAPVVLTDDRINYLNPLDATRAEFTVKHDSARNEHEIIFGGNSNIFDNSDFSSFTSGTVPSDWITPVQTGQSGVFLLWSQFSYYGDYAVGLKLDGTIGYIMSKKIDVAHDDAVSLTWHSRIPSDITGATGQLITGATGYYFVKFYDNYDELMPYSVTGSFVANATGYTRYYLQLGASDTVINPNLDGLASAPLEYISDAAIGMPENVTKFEFILSGANHNSVVMNDSFIIIDAIQGEYSSSPSYYHPKPSLTDITVECETSLSGVFTDNRMNISSIVNENPNGFLSITDMPAYLWGGPHDPEVTTLHEHRWPHGRLYVMPWARLYGKDKLKQKAKLAGVPAYVLDVGNPYVMPRGAAEAIITPSTIFCNQDAVNPEGFHVQILDSFNNPYSLRNYVAHVYSETNRFPGWLSRRHYGAKEQLGSTIYGKLNNNGSFVGSYIGPSSSHIRYVGSVPTPITTVSGLTGLVDTISIVETSYNCSVDGNANITIIGANGEFAPVNGTEILSGEFYTQSNRDTSYIVTQYPPVFGTVTLEIDGVQYFETQGPPQSNEFNIDYLASQINLPLAVKAGTIASVEYRPRYAYPDYKNLNHIILHNNMIFGSYNGPIQIDYDAEIKLEVRVSDPMDREFLATFPIVLQNPQLGYIKENISTFEF